MLVLAHSAAQVCFVLTMLELHRVCGVIWPVFPPTSSRIYFAVMLVFTCMCDVPLYASFVVVLNVLMANVVCFHMDYSVVRVTIDADDGDYNACLALEQLQHGDIKRWILSIADPRFPEILQF